MHYLVAAQIFATPFAELAAPHGSCFVVQISGFRAVCRSLTEFGS